MSGSLNPMTSKSIQKIIGEGFLDFIPYVTPAKNGDLPHNCAACTFDSPSRISRGVFHYQQYGKTLRWKFWLRSGWYCKNHVWEAITQDAERNRYRRWQRKYFAAIKHEIGQYKESNGTDSD